MDVGKHFGNKRDLKRNNWNDGDVPRNFEKKVWIQPILMLHFATMMFLRMFIES